MFQPKCRTTAMSILPHQDIEQALKLILNLDIPFWPQLPNVSIFEDMYVQASYDFPGIIISPEDGKITFSRAKFEVEIDAYSGKMADPNGFILGEDYGEVYRRFLSENLNEYHAIHGQVTGPVNLGFRINDEEGKPIIYDDNIRGLLFDFIHRKFNAQYRQLKEKNENAFIWLDEPGLIWVFSGLAGYNDIHAKRDYSDFLTGLEGIRAMHMCTNINLTYLLGLGIDLLSFDAYQLEVMPRGYAESIAAFICNGGVISWGIVPTEPLLLAKETPESLQYRLLDYWEVVAKNTSLPTGQIAAQALLAPAKCCVKSLEFTSAGEKSEDCEIELAPGLSAEEESVEKAYGYLREISATLRKKFKLYDS
jgi:hypothetical protein